MDREAEGGGQRNTAARNRSIHYQGPQSTLQIQTEILDVDTTPSRYQFLEQFDSH